MADPQDDPDREADRDRPEGRGGRGPLPEDGGGVYPAAALGQKRCGAWFRKRLADRLRRAGSVVAAAPDR